MGRMIQMRNPIPAVIMGTGKLTDRKTEDVFWYVRMALRSQKYVSVKFKDETERRRVKANLRARTVKRGWNWNFNSLGSELIISQENHVRG